MTLASKSVKLPRRVFGIIMSWKPMNKYTIPKLYDADGDLSRQWYVYYFFQHPETGKMQRFRVAISRRLLTKAARYERATEIKAELKSKLLKGFNPFHVDSRKNTNAVEAIEYALKFKITRLGKRTKSSYSSVLRMFTAWLKANRLDRRTIENITSQVAEQYTDYMMMDIEISNRTFNNRLEVMRTIFNVLVKKQYTDTNPFTYVDYIPTPEPEITAFTRKELKLINEQLPGHHYQLWVVSQFIFYCFLRPAELVRLQFKHVLWEHGIITVPGVKAKNGNSQVVVLPIRLKENLKSWNRCWPDDYYLFAHGRNLKPGLKEIAPTRIAEAWREFGEKYGITKNIYDLKHTGNGYAFDQGLNVRDIQLQNRHHSLEQTQQYLNKFRRKPSDGFRENFNGF